MRILVETERLWLREMTEADADDLFLLHGNPNVMRYLVGEPPLSSRSDGISLVHERIFPQYHKYGIGRWAVILKESHAFIGWCGVKYLPETNEYDLGYRFMENRWGKGYATEAAQAVLRYCDQHLPDKRIVGKAAIGNVGSIRVLEKIGMKFEGRVRETDGIVAVYTYQR